MERLAMERLEQVPATPAEEHGAQVLSSQPVWEAFEEGCAAGDRAARYDDLQEPGPLLYEDRELFAQWCDGVIDAWAARLEEEAEDRGCECDDSSNYVCCNHRECPLHRQKAEERFSAWLEARAGGWRERADRLVEQVRHLAQVRRQPDRTKIDAVVALLEQEAELLFCFEDGVLKIAQSPA